MDLHRRTFFDAWVAAATGPDGFWAGAWPSHHFRTASTAGGEMAEAVATLLRQRRVHRVVEIGAGDGALLAGLSALTSDVEVIGVDLRQRPAGLPAAIGWHQDCWSVTTGSWTDGGVPELLGSAEPTLVVAVEWLDDLPCRLASATRDGWLELDQDQYLADPLPAADQDWLRAWWPDGERAEVGRTRDEAWAAIIRALRPAGGAALLVDYGHHRDHRPPAGTLAAYRAGRAVPIRPTPDRNLTAHLALDAVEAAGRGAGATTVWQGRQAHVLADLLPAPEPTDPLTALATRSRRAALTSAAGWGSHAWLLQEVAGGPVAA